MKNNVKLKFGQSVYVIKKRNYTWIIDKVKFIKEEWCDCIVLTNDKEDRFESNWQVTGMLKIARKYMYLTYQGAFNKTQSEIRRNRYKIMDGVALPRITDEVIKENFKLKFGDDCFIIHGTATIRIYPAKFIGSKFTHSCEVYKGGSVLEVKNCCIFSCVKDAEDYLKNPCVSNNAIPFDKKVLNEKEMTEALRVL